MHDAISNCNLGNFLFLNFTSGPTGQPHLVSLLKKTTPSEIHQSKNEKKNFNQFLNVPILKKVDFQNCNTVMVFYSVTFILSTDSFSIVG